MQQAEQIREDIDRFIDLVSRKIINDETLVLCVSISDALVELVDTVFLHGDKVSWNGENGMVRSCRDDLVFVVYKCNDDWENFSDYTAAATKKSELSLGWVS